jgi:hypothetical protein
MAEPPPQANETPTAALLRAARRALRPMVALAIRKGATFPVLADTLRQLYVDVATREFLPDDKSRTDSRISLLTGVHRKEIRRLRDEAGSDSPPPESVSVGALAIARWVAMGDGAPPPLPRSGAAGRPSFEALIAGVTTDIRPRAVLDDWLAQGIVEQGADGALRLAASAYVPAPGSEAQMFFFGRNLGDHAAAAAANVAAGAGVPFLDRAAHYDRISPGLAQRIEARAREVAERALREINAYALAEIAAEEAGDPPPGGTGARVNIGIYALREDSGDSAPQALQGKR